MKRFLYGLIFLLIIVGLMVLSKIIHINPKVLAIGVALLLTLLLWIKMNIITKKISNESDEYEKFLEDNDFNKYDNTLLKKEIHTKELELCNKFLKNNPKNLTTLSRKAFLLFKLKKYQESIEVYKIVTRKNGHIPEDFLNYAQCYYYLGDKKKAFKIIDDFCSLFDVAEQYKYYAEMYKNLKLYDKAIENCTSAIDLRPDCSFYLSDRAEIYKITKQYDKALEDYTKAIELGTKYLHLYVKRADIYKLMKQYDKALEDYTKAIELGTKSDFGYIHYINRARVYAIIKDYDKAIADLKKIGERLNKSNNDSHYENTIFMFEYQEFLISNDFDILADDSENEENTLKELELCDKFLKENPNNIYAVKQKADAYLRLDKYKEAIENYTLAIEHRPDYPYSYESRAKAYKALGEQDKYEADMKKFEELEEEYNNDDIEDEEIDDNSSKEGLNKNLKP